MATVRRPPIRTGNPPSKDTRTMQYERFSMLPALDEGEEVEDELDEDLEDEDEVEDEDDGDDDDFGDDDDEADDEDED